MNTILNNGKQCKKYAITSVHKKCTKSEKKGQQYALKLEAKAPKNFFKFYKLCTWSAPKIQKKMQF